MARKFKFTEEFNQDTLIASMKPGMQSQTHTQNAVGLKSHIFLKEYIIE